MVRLPQQTTRTPINYDWGEETEQWAVMFDAHRHSLPYASRPFILGLIEADARGSNLPEVAVRDRLTPLEFEFFDLFFLRNHNLEECVFALEISWWKTYELYKAIKVKLAPLFEGN